MDEGPDRSSVGAGMLLDRGRETIGTTLLDAEPDVILKMPGDSYAPLLLALAMTAAFVALLLHSRLGVRDSRGHNGAYEHWLAVAGTVADANRDRS
jgi:hypothetical protein